MAPMYAIKIYEVIHNQWSRFLSDAINNVEKQFP